MPFQLARKLANSVYDLTDAAPFQRDYGLRDQIRRAAGPSMHNIAEGFDAGSNLEFMKFLRYAQRSCTEVQSQLYLALDRSYLIPKQFNTVYQKAADTRDKIGGFIKYLRSRNI